jgi:hypothetical protein
MSQFASQSLQICKMFDLQLTTVASANTCSLMNGAVEILRRERLQAQEQVKVLRARIRDLDSAIALLDASATNESQRPQGDLKHKVLAYLSELSGRGATPNEIASALTAAGRNTSDQSVSSTLSRLKAEGRVRNASGNWFAANDIGDSQSEEPTRTTEVSPDDFDDLDDIPF